MFHFAATLLAALLIHVALSAPLITFRQSITTLTAAEISPYEPYAYFASAGYCSPSSTLSWSCGGLSSPKARQLYEL